MNILFFASTGKSGSTSGGHYHSLDQISKEVGKGNKVAIIVIGPLKSPILLKNKFFTEHIYIDNKISGLFFLNRKLKKVIRNFKPDVLHCFDVSSLNFLMVLPVTFNLPIVLNKCGGPNPLRNNYQHANELILFSAENFNWFNKNKHYSNETIHLIPNRVEKLNYIDESKRKIKKDNNKITFLRVSRLGGAYDKTLSDSLKMIEELMVDYPVQLIVVGTIQDKTKFGSFIKVVKDKNLPVVFITDKRAEKGSDFLYLADFVIGTGRSFMEAVSLGIPTLTPAMNSEWPILVNHENFQNFFRTNFSERNIADKSSLEYNKKEIINLMNDKSAYKNAMKSVSLLFEQYISAKQILSKYYLVYKRAKFNPTQRFTLIIKNFPYLLKYYFL